MKLIERLRKRSPRNQNDGFDFATERDIYYCYRLFLHREPDAGGLAHYKRLIARNQISIQYLAACFLKSVEFRNTQTQLSAPTLVNLPYADLFVRMNDYFIGAGIARNKVYEPHVTQAIKDLLKPGAIFIDIGANIGYFTMLAASLVGSQGRVFAFEPNPANCELIRLSCDQNGFEHVQLFENALAESAQLFDFCGDGGSNGRIIHETEANEEAAEYQVQAVTLDETLPDLPRVDLIKMDIEGAEPRAWQGMMNIVHEHRPTIIFEFSPPTIRQTSQVEPEIMLNSMQTIYELYALPADGKKSDHALSTAEIMDNFTGSRHHLDLIASPR